MNDRYEIQPRNLATTLWKRGWLRQNRLEDAQKASPTRLLSAVRAYQKFHGLKVDGWPGPVTERSLRQLRICGLPDRITMRSGRLCRWPMKRITWTVSGRLPGISVADHKAVFAEAWKMWSDVCDIDPVYTRNARTANVVMGSGRIDRAGGTLAESELPCGVDENSQLQQLYDIHEPWGIVEPLGPGQIGLGGTAGHEVGHALGIPHLGRGNLMQPTHDRLIQRPQPGDIAEIVRRYGERAAPPPSTDDEQLTIRIQGEITALEIPGYRVSKLAEVAPGG